MAPSKRDDHLEENEAKQDLFKNVKFEGKIPENFLSFKHLERDYGIGMKDLINTGVSFDNSDCVIKGLKKGKVAIFFSPDFVDDLRNSVKDEKIGSNFVSESFLSKCVERKGMFQKGWIKRYRTEDPDVTPPGKGWAVFGKKEDYHGPATYFYPRAFIKAKLKMSVAPADAQTLYEINQSGNLKLKDEAQSIWGIRVDGIPRGPDSYYLQKDVIKKYYLM